MREGERAREIVSGRQREGEKEGVRESETELMRRNNVGLLILTE